MINSILDPKEVELDKETVQYENKLRPKTLNQIIGREKEISVSCTGHNLFQTRLIYRKLVEVITIPSCNPFGIDIHNCNFNLGALRGNHSHCRPANITGSDTANL